MQQCGTIIAPHKNGGQLGSAERIAARPACRPVKRNLSPWGAVVFSRQRRVADAP